MCLLRGTDWAFKYNRSYPKVHPNTSKHLIAVIWIFMSSWICSTLRIQNTEKRFVRKAITSILHRTVSHSKRPNLAIHRLRKFKWQNTKYRTEPNRLCSVQSSSASCQILTVCVLCKPFDCLLFQLGVFLAHVDTRHYATSQNEVQMSSVYIHCKRKLSWATMGTSDRVSDVLRELEAFFTP